MDAILEVIFAPAEYEALGGRALSGSVCVVFDVLRATTSMVTALGNGAEGILPVAEIAEALDEKRKLPEALLAGEREGMRILAARTGSLDFDLGNSPREFTNKAVQGKTIVMTTTNGTRALRACAPAETVLVASFGNLEATVAWLEKNGSKRLFLVCGGTADQASYEDALGAGALCERVWDRFEGEAISDAALMSRTLYRMAQHDLLGAVQMARNGRRLQSKPELREDLSICVQRDLWNFAAALQADGIVRKIS
jgi:2-phosphosulfolactate phosphatase